MAAPVNAELADEVHRTDDDRELHERLRAAG
jgi:hypothetical protein